MLKELTNEKIREFLETKPKKKLKFKREGLLFEVVVEGENLTTVRAEHEEDSGLFGIKTSFSNDDCIKTIQKMTLLLSVYY